MSHRHCHECLEPFKSHGGGKLALFTPVFSYGLSSATLCDACHARFKESGVSGIPNVAGQAREAAAAARRRY
jgi:cytochrome c553